MTEVERLQRIADLRALRSKVDIELRRLSARVAAAEAPSPESARCSVRHRHGLLPPHPHLVRAGVRRMQGGPQSLRSRTRKASTEGCRVMANHCQPRPGRGVEVRADHARKWDNKGEPDRGVSAPQPGSDRLHLRKKGGGW